MGKPSPKFWWDFRDNDIIVQSDYKGGQCLAKFPILGDDASSAIKKADDLISDFEAGRKTPEWNKHEDN